MGFWHGVDDSKNGGIYLVHRPSGIPFFCVNLLTSQMFDRQLTDNQLTLCMKPLILLAYMRLQIIDSIKYAFSGGSK